MGLFGFRGEKKKQQEEQAVEKKGVENEKIADKQVMVEKSKVGASTSGKEVARLPELSSGTTSTDVSVFEFGTALESEDKVTLAGYCPVSDEMEPCRWEILPQTQSEAPGFRIIF